MEALRKVAVQSGLTKKQFDFLLATLGATPEQITTTLKLSGVTEAQAALEPYSALINKATEQFRQFTGKIRSEGAKEALTQETRVIPLLNPTATTTSEQPSPNAKAPLTSDEAYSLHLKMLKQESERSRRGLRQ